MYLSNQRQREKIRIVADRENETKQQKKRNTKNIVKENCKVSRN